MYGNFLALRDLALPLGELAAQPPEREIDSPLACYCHSKVPARPSHSPSVTALPEGEPRAAPSQKSSGTHAGPGDALFCFAVLLGRRFFRPVEKQDIHDEQRAARCYEAVGHVEYGEIDEFQTDHVRHCAGDDAVDEVAERAARDHREAHELKSLLQDLFPDQHAEDDEKHRRHQHEQPRLPLEHRPRRAGVLDVCDVEKARNGPDDGRAVRARDVRHRQPLRPLVQPDDHGRKGGQNTVKHVISLRYARACARLCATASSSQRLFLALSAWPFTQFQLTRCVSSRGSSSCHRSTFSAGFLSALIQPRARQP